MFQGFSFGQTAIEIQMQQLTAAPFLCFLYQSEGGPELIDASRWKPLSITQGTLGNGECSVAIARVPLKQRGLITHSQGTSSEVTVQ